MSIILFPLVLFCFILGIILFAIPFRLLGCDLEDTLNGTFWCGFFTVSIGVIVGAIIGGILEDTDFSIARLIGLELDSTPTANGEIEFFLTLASGPALVAGIIIVVLMICVLVRFIRKISKG